MLLLGRPSNWRKKRIHFHDFMLNVHSHLQVIFFIIVFLSSQLQASGRYVINVVMTHFYMQMHKGVSDPLDVVAAEISDEAIILCLDEFMVFSTGVKYCSNLLIFMFVTCPTVPRR